jgi:hypothetical protein
MGIVASVTPGFKRNSTVPRVNVDIEELKKLANFDIKFYGLGLNIQSPLKYKKLPPVQATSCSEDISLLSIYPHAMKGTVPIYRSYIMIYIVCNVLKMRTS